MKRSSKQLVLLVLLALQLVFGLQGQVAWAEAPAPMPAHTQTSAHMAAMAPGHTQSAAGMAHADCPMHDATGSSKQPPPGSHDCCHAGACQCHCVYTPTVMAPPSLTYIAPSIAVPSWLTNQFVAPRIDEFLRPPIA